MMQEKTKRIWTNILFSIITVFWIAMVYLQERTTPEEGNKIREVEPTKNIIRVVKPSKEISTEQK